MVKKYTISDEIKETTGASLECAIINAAMILNSGILADFVTPRISVDQYGEFSFSVKNSRGYLDIGVDGKGSISYHVRNDIDPSKSVYGDERLDGYELPTPLVDGVAQLFEDTTA